MTPETILIEDASGTTRARVMPALGFNCYSFQVTLRETPVEVLWADPEFAAGEKRPTRSGIPILFPFAGRIGGTTFRYAGCEYHLEPSDEFGNAIHGFVVHRPWRVVERSTSSVTGEFQPSQDDPAILEHWPTDFRIRVTYRVTPGTLRSDVEIENAGSGVLPCGLGLHGYYRVPLGAGPAAQCMVRVPVGDRWELANMLPTGRRTPTDVADRLSAGMPFGETHLDDVFDRVAGADGVCTTTVVDPLNRRTMTMQFGKLFNECVVFNPPHREAICIEPYTTTPDAFALIERGVDPHLMSIEAGASLRTWFEIRLSAD
jgi:aldose 1-epimerase